MENVEEVTSTACRPDLVGDGKGEDCSQEIYFPSWNLRGLPGDPFPRRKAKKQVLRALTLQSYDPPDNNNENFPDHLRNIGIV
jgi:hypothetical protein